MNNETLDFLHRTVERNVELREFRRQTWVLLEWLTSRDGLGYTMPPEARKAITDFAKQWQK